MVVVVEDGFGLLCFIFVVGCIVYFALFSWFVVVVVVVVLNQVF